MQKQINVMLDTKTIEIMNRARAINNSEQRIFVDAAIRHFADHVLKSETIKEVQMLFSGDLRSSPEISGEQT
jgi:hypothetical protein